MMRFAFFAELGVLLMLFAALFFGCGSTTGPQVGVEAAPATIDNGVEQRINGEPVTAILRLSKESIRRGETVDVSIRLQIAPRWDIRTLNSLPPNSATRLELEFPPGLQAVDEWQAPKPVRSTAADGHAAYEGEVIFTQKVAVNDNAQAGKQDVRCRIGYQACDDQRCLQPAIVELTVPLEIQNSEVGDLTGP
jgi:hypothetical protein